MNVCLKEYINASNKTTRRHRMKTVNLILYTKRGLGSEKQWLLKEELKTLFKLQG